MSWEGQRHQTADHPTSITYLCFRTRLCNNNLHTDCLGGVCGLHFGWDGPGHCVFEMSAVCQVAPIRGAQGQSLGPIVPWPREVCKGNLCVEWIGPFFLLRPLEDCPGPPTPDPKLCLWGTLALPSALTRLPPGSRLFCLPWMSPIQQQTPGVTRKDTALAQKPWMHWMMCLLRSRWGCRL